MRRHSLAAFAFAVLTPVIATAQQNARMTGVVIDQANLVLPGVSVSATDVTSGRQVSVLTNQQGEYTFLSLPPSRYRLQAELQGFQTISREIELLVGQSAAVLPLVMKVAGVAETVEVTGEIPLVAVRTSQVAGNVDRRQMEELPLAGRNWMELALQVKGITANNVDVRPGIARDEDFELNLDGQQVTSKISGSTDGQPKFSREAIAEFQIVTNLFDITQGRSTGSQVQAISKAGTNTLHGAGYGYFRNDKFNAADHVAGHVLPYSNQQAGAAVGGPIVRDRLQYFATYEYEREPTTWFIQPTLFPDEHFTFENTTRQNSVLARVDHSLSTRDRFTYRYSQYDRKSPFEPASATDYPTITGNNHMWALNLLATWSRVVNDHTVQEVKVGYDNFGWTHGVAVPSMADRPILQFSSQIVGANAGWPSKFNQRNYSVRYDLTSTRASHEFKIGGEFLHWHDTGSWETGKKGAFLFSKIPPDLEQRFPEAAWNDPSQWNLTGLGSYIQEFDQSYGNFNIDIPRPTWAVWFGDSWRIGKRLTLNYGVRWDVDWGEAAPPGVPTQTTFAPFNGPLFKADIHDNTDVAPRVGFAYNVGARNDFVIRGGTGLYYGIVVSNMTYNEQLRDGGQVIPMTFPNDGLPGFINDPTRGITAADVLAGRVPAPILALVAIAHDFKNPRTHQSSIGFQKQLSEVLGIEADLVYSRMGNMVRGRDLNLFYDPVTGYNRDPAKFGRPDPKFGQVTWYESTGRGDYLALSSGLTRRLRNRLQVGVTDTVMFFKRDDTTSFGVAANNPFDLDADFSRSADFQRNTVHAYALYGLPWGVSISGAYSYGSGNYYATTVSGRPYNKPGTNRLNIGAPIVIPEAVLDRFDGPAVIGTGQVVPRNALKGFPLYKVDLRVTKTIRVRGSARLLLQAEVFNVFDHANYGAYNGVVNTSDFGARRQVLGNAYAPRTGQLGVRLEF